MIPLEASVPRERAASIPGIPPHRHASNGMIRRLAVVTALALLVGTGIQRPLVAYADPSSSSGKSIVEQVGCDQTPNDPCQIQDFINLFVYLAKWGLSILVFLGMLMLLYGGFQFVTAGGRASKIDEGKRVITGTIVGVIIALTAYIIINFTVTAVSGFSIPSSNPFGPIGAVFSGTPTGVTIQGQTSLQKPFSGSSSSGSSSSSTSGPPSCTSGASWDTSCNSPGLQVDCADPAANGGPVKSLQTTLNAKGCNCGPADGCYGPLTVGCVRQFQVANQLPPSGVVDDATNGKLQGGANCTVGGADAQVSAELPDTVMTTGTGSDSGCCIVKDGPNEIYCANGISTRACQALGDGSQLYAGACGEPGPTAGHCGFCSNMADISSTSPTKACFQVAAPYWCTSIATGNFFNIGNCSGICANCTNTLAP